MASSRRFCFSVRIEEGKVTIIALRGQKSAASHRENPAAGPRKVAADHFRHCRLQLDGHLVRSGKQAGNVLRQYGGKRVVPFNGLRKLQSA